MSNGSEHTPERCVHAVDGPDWAGLRELYPAEVDYKALVKQARGFVPIMESGNLILALADAVEALAAENEKLREANAGLVEHSKSVHSTSYGLAYADAAAAVSFIRYSGHAEYQGHATGDIVEWLRNRGNDLMQRGDNPADALQAERDALQARLDAMTVEERFAPFTHQTHGQPLKREQRLVGPWTVVPEGDGNV